MTRIAVIDYGVGNIKSICRAFERYDVEICLTNEQEAIVSSDGVVLPGVGAFAHGMGKLKEYGLDDTLRECSVRGGPILGICLGMQMFFDTSTEFGVTEGLGLIPGEVLKIEPGDPIYMKLPHVSWNGIHQDDPASWDGTILDGLDDSEDVYFVHSYYVKPENRDHVLSKTFYSNFEYCSTVKSGNIFGCQYHPEKSGQVGLKIINNFVKICQR